MRGLPLRMPQHTALSSPLCLLPEPPRRLQPGGSLFLQALIRDEDGWNALAYAAQQRDPAVVAALLANPVSREACRVTFQGWLPIHLAAEIGNAATVAQLLAAYPQSAAARHFYPDGMTPLDTCLLNCADADQRAAVARVLLPAGPAATALESLLAAGPAGQQLLPVFVAARMPLSGELWGALPVACPGLGRLLPAALAHSPEQARLLVQHLPAADAQRLRLFALCLARAQRRAGVRLPSEMLAQLLSLFDA